MAKELKLRRGNATDHALFVGAEGEITYNSDSKSFRAHDGITTGGFETARNDLSNVSNADFAAKASSAGVSGGAGGGGVNGADANASYLIIGPDVWGLQNERRLQVSGAMEASDGGSGGGYTLSVKLANAVSGPPSNLGAASFGASTFVARADHVHAMPTANDVQAIPSNRVITPGIGLAVTSGGLLTANTTVSLNAVLNDLTDVTISGLANNDILVYNGATSRWINFTGNSLGRMTVRDEGAVIGNANAITQINFVGNGITTTVDGGDPTKVIVTVPTIFDQEEVEDIVGAMVSGNIESGINVSYNDTTGKLNFDVNDFTITLTGDVQATGTVTDLGNISLNTVIAANSIALGTDTTGSYVQSVTAATTPNGLVVTGPNAEASDIQLALNLSDADFVEGVQDIIGSMVSGNTELGINVTYNDAGGKLNFQTNNFSITLQGAVEGSGTVTNLSNVLLNTSVAVDSITLGTHTTGAYVASLSGGANGVIVTGSGVESASVGISLDMSNGQFVENIQDIVGTMVTAPNTEQFGIAVAYDDINGKLDFDVADFTITLGGDLTGAATVTNLGSTTLTATIAANSVALGTDTTGNYVASIVPGSNGIVVTGSGSENAAVTIELDTNAPNFIEGVQDAVGGMVSSNVEAGLAVTYDDNTGKLNFDVNDSVISVNGVVTGSGTMTNLGNVAITTALSNDSVALGTHTTGSYVQSVAPTGTSNGITVSGSGGEGAAVSVGLNLIDANFVEGVQDILGTMFTGNIQNGIATVYDDNTGKLHVDAADFSITLAGDVTGTATVTNLGNVTLNTTVAANSVALGSDTTGSYIRSAIPGSGGVSVTILESSTDDAFDISIGLDLQGSTQANTVQDIVGEMVNGNIEDGLSVVFNPTTRKLNFDVNDPTITLNGAITGSAKMTNLGNVAITTALGTDSVTLGTHTTGNYIATLSGDTNGITISGSGVESAAAGVALDMTNINFVEGIQDIVGTMVTNGSKAGISVIYVDGAVGAGKIDFDVADFSITLTGDVTGSGTVTNLGNVSFATTIGPNSVALGTDTTGNYVATAIGGANGITVVGSGVENAALTLDLDLGDTEFVAGVQGIVGAMVSGNTESGINVTSSAGKLNFDVNDPVISLGGVLSGSATMTNLGNVSITAVYADNSIALGQHTTGNYIATLSGDTNGITISGSGTETAAASVALDMANINFVEGIQDIVGTMVTNGSKAGISVIYVDGAVGAGKLDFDVNDFSITLTGDVTGTGTVTNLGNVSFATTIAADSVALGTDTTGNYIATAAAGANGISIIGSGVESAALTVDLDLGHTGFVTGVQGIVGAMVSGNTENGINVTSSAGKLHFDVNDPVISLTGALSGSATMTNLGNVAISTALSNDSVTLGTHTVGSYVAGITGDANGVTITGATGEGSTPAVALDLGNLNFVEGIQDIVGTMVTNGSKAGISVIYTDGAIGAGKLDFDVNDFSITLTGDVTGSGTVTNLGNVSFTTTIAPDSVALGTDTTGNYIATAVAGANGITIVGSGVESAALTVDIDLADIDFVNGVQGIVGSMVSGNTELGINVTSSAGKLHFDVNDPVITLGGALSGSATMTNLGNVTISAGIVDNAISLGQHTVGNYIATLAAGANGITVSGSGTETAAATVNLDLGNANFVEGVQDIIGTMVTSNVENGINVTYDDPNGKLNFEVNNFAITLTGDVTGTGTVTNLGNVSFATTVAANSVALGADTTGNYVGTVAPAATSYGITVSGGTGEGVAALIALDPNDANFVEGVQDIIGTMVSGNIENGIAVTYDDTLGKVNFDVNDFTLSLTGALTGSATVTNLASTNLVSSIANDAVTLGLHTVGNYVGTVAPAATSNGITIGGAAGEGTSVLVGLDLADTNFMEGVQDIVGTMVTGNVETGINVTYNDAGPGTGKLDFAVNNFTISLNGATTGSAVVSNLGNVAITTTLAADAVALGAHTTGNYVANVTAQATSNGITVTGALGEGQNAQIGFNLNEANFVEAVQDHVATMYDGVHTGITSTYNDPTGKITLAVTNGVVDAASLGTHAAATYPRKAEAAQITAQWNFNNHVFLNKATLNNLLFTDALSLNLNGVGPALEIDPSRNVTVTAGALKVGVNTVIHEGNLTNNAILKEAVEDHVATLFSTGTHSFINFVYDDANARMSASVNTVNLSADLLDGHDSTAFTRKAENATVTGDWRFLAGTGVDTTAAVVIAEGDLSRSINFYPHLSAGSKNGIMAAGDSAMLAAGGGTGLVLAKEAAGTSGIRITDTTVNVEGVFTRGGVNVLTESTGLTKAATHAASGVYAPDSLSISGLTSGDNALDGEAAAGWHILTSMRAGNTNYGVQLGISDTNTGHLKVRSKVNGTWSNWGNVWHENNDGAGSGLDADTIGGIASSALLKTTGSQTVNASNDTSKMIVRMNSGQSVTTASDNNAPLEIHQTAVTGDSFMSFYQNGFATHFGLDRSTSDIFVGGWSMGSAKNRIYHAGNDHHIAQTLRSNANMTGGGVLSYNAGRVSWTQRLIIISNGSGSHFSPSGYFDIVMPTSGTITGVGGATNKTATASGITLSGWEALYYILPIGGGSATVNANFRVATYTAELAVPSNWVLIALCNGDDGTVRFSNVPHVLRAGDSYTAAASNAWGINFAPDANNTRNIGTASTRYANIYAVTFNGTATSAQYADMAERYAADAKYAPGTVVVFGGTEEVTVSSTRADRRVAGVISTDPAYMMNSDAGSDETHPYVALVGRVPCFVTGKVRKGDMLTTSEVAGHAMATDNPQLGSIIGKALEDFDGETGVIEIAVQRM